MALLIVKVADPWARVMNLGQTTGTTLTKNRQTLLCQVPTVLAPQWWNELPADIRVAHQVPQETQDLPVHLDLHNHPSFPLRTLALICVFVRLGIINSTWHCLAYLRLSVFGFYRFSMSRSV